MMLCAKCAEELPDNAKFCKGCGSPVAQLQPDPTQTTSAAGRLTGSTVNCAGEKKQMKVKRRDYRDIKLRFLQGFVCLVLSFSILFFALLENTIKAIVDSNVVGGFSLYQVMNVLISGTDLYNSSVISIVEGLFVLVFIIAASVFWLCSFVAVIIGRGEKGMRIIAVILTFVMLCLACVLPHIAYISVPHFKLAYARTIGVLPSNMHGMSAMLLYIWTVFVLLLMTVIWIIGFKRSKGKG